MSQEWVGSGGALGIGVKGRDTPAAACAKTHPIGNAYRGRNGGKNCCRGNSCESVDPRNELMYVRTFGGFCYGLN